MGLSAGGWGAHTCYAGAPEGRAPLMTLSALLQVPPPQMSFTSSVRSQILIKQLPLMCNKQIRMKNFPVLFFHSELLDWVSSVWCGVSNSACFLLSSFHLFWAFYFLYHLLLSFTLSGFNLPVFIFSNIPPTIPCCCWTCLHSSFTYISFSVHVPFLIAFINLFSFLFHYLFCSSHYLFFICFCFFFHFFLFFLLFFYYLFVFCISFVFYIFVFFAKCTYIYFIYFIIFNFFVHYFILYIV